MKAEDKDLNRLIDKVDRILEKELPKDVDSLIEWGEKYANQRVIEELEWLTTLFQGVDIKGVGRGMVLLSENLEDRIKELKQE